jgi:hypothetical protein
MLAKEKCIEAINKWGVARSDYSRIELLIPPGWIFNLTQVDCQWIIKNNKANYFHTYAGINENDTMILIVVPLDYEEKEIELPSYLTANLGPLKKGLTVVDTSIITTTQKAILSSVLDLEDYSEEIESVPKNAPSINERTAITDLVKWKNSYLDWFYHECTDFNGKRIFRAFRVPCPDLKIDEGKDGEDVYDEVIVTFAFKTSDIYQMDIPILIFIGAGSNMKYSQIIHSKDTDSGTNTRDYSHPCPPMCRLEKSFALLGLTTE